MESLRAHRPSDVLQLVLVTLLLFIPFLNKAFHIDDPLFVWTAQNILERPLAPYHFDVNWYLQLQPMAEVMQNPPLFSYYLAPFGWAFGWSEVVMHASVLLIAISAVLGIYALACRLCDRPLLATYLGLVTPALVVSGTQIMCDILLLSLWVWGLWFWMIGIDERRPSALLVAALLAGAAALTKYFGIASLFLMALYAVWTPRRQWWTLAYLLLPVLLLAGYESLTKSQYGTGSFSEAAHYATSRSLTGLSRMVPSLISGAIFVGGCLAPLWVIPAIMKPQRGLWIFTGALVLSQVLLIANGIYPAIGVRDHLGIQWKLLATSSILLSGGIYILLLPILDFLHRRDRSSAFLGSMVLGTFVFVTCVNWTVNARVLLPIIPAASILLVRREELALAKVGMGSWLLRTGVVAAGLFAFAIADADARFANCDREAARQLLQNYGGRSAPITFSGHWGFQHYMQEGGAVAVDATRDQFRPGQIFICAFSNSNFIFLPIDVAAVLERRDFAVGGWIATMSIPRSAGFHSTSFGRLPFQFGRVSPHQFIIQETFVEFDLPLLLEEKSAELRQTFGVPAKAKSPLAPGT